MVLTVVYLFAGLALLVAGAEGLVRGSVSLALRLNVSSLVIGLTVVAFGTSSPELVVSVDASIRGSDALAIGNIVGSNIGNIALILGASAVIAPVMVSRQVVRRDAPIMMAITVLLGSLLWMGRVSRISGIMLVIGLVAYTFFSYYLDERLKSDQPDLGVIVTTDSALRLWKSLLFVAAGLGALIFGANLFVNSAIGIATALGISEAVIGLSVVAIGTSLPELATAVSASLRRESDLIAGNVIGSNIFNVLCVLGIASIILPLSAEDITGVDILLLVGLAAYVWLVMATGHRVTRMEGAVLLMTYGAYIFYLF